MRSTIDPEPELLTVVDLMRLFQTSYRATLRRIRGHLIPFGAVVRVGTRYFIQKDILREWLDSKTVHREPKPRTDSIWMQRRGKNGRTTGKGLWQTKRRGKLRG